MRIVHIFALFALTSAPAHAAPYGAKSEMQSVLPQGDALIEGAKQCTRYLPRYERQYGIPLHLLSAISSTETGRWHKGLSLALPWPWTINAEGKGYYFNSKQEAIAAAMKLRSRGVKSMDVGCMQVNLYHHANAFRDLHEAFEPERNVAYAASFLRNLYQEQGNWKQAAASYHSRTPSLGAQYVGKVYDSWYSIIDKLRLARTVVAAADVQSPVTAPFKAPARPQVKINAPETASVQPAGKLGEQAGKKIAAQKPVHMKIIKVTDSKPKRENGIIVIRPQASDVKISASKEMALASSPAASSNSALSPASGAGAARGSGPRFIFTD